MIGRKWLAAVVAAGAMLTGAGTAQAAAPGIYFGDLIGQHIKHAEPDGSNVRTIVSPGNVTGLARHGNTLFFGRDASGNIGRVGTDGSGLNTSFITGVTRAWQLAANDTHLYWTDRDVGKIGRAKLDGSAVQTDLIQLPGHDKAEGLAIDGTYVYWVNITAGWIGRAKLDGSAVQHQWLDVGAQAGGVAVGGGYVFWGNGFPTSNIGRANLDGSGANPTFLADVPGAAAMTIAGNRLYWGVMSISHVNLDGSALTTGLVTGHVSVGLAIVDPAASPPTSDDPVAPQPPTVTEPPTGPSEPAACRSTRTITFKPRRGERYTRVDVLFGGKRVQRISKPGRALKVSLAGLPKGTAKVRISVRDAKGRTSTRTRAFRTCTPGT